MMKLCGFPSSTNTWMVRALAAHLSIPLEFQFFDPNKGELRNPEFLKLNPTGRVPVLVDSDFVLWEANAIMQYLASKKPSSLWPDDVRVRADIMRWQSWQLAHWTGVCQPLVFQNFVKPLLKLGEPDVDVVKQTTEAFHKEAAVLDQHLSNRQYLVNNSLTLADFAVGSYLAYAKPARFPLEPYANIRNWSARFDALPAWRETAPEM